MRSQKRVSAGSTAIATAGLEQHPRDWPAPTRDSAPPTAWSSRAGRGFTGPPPRSPARPPGLRARLAAVGLRRPARSGHPLRRRVHGQRRAGALPPDSLRLQPRLGLHRAGPLARPRAARFAIRHLRELRRRRLPARNRPPPGDLRRRPGRRHESTGAAATKPNRTERDARKKPRQRPHLRRRQERARTAGRECGPAHALGPHRRLMDELTRHRASRKPTAPRRHSPAQSPALRPPWWTYMGSGRLNARRTWHASSWATAES